MHGVIARERERRAGSPNGTIERVINTDVGDVNECTIFHDVTLQ